MTQRTPSTGLLAALTPMGGPGGNSRRGRWLFLAVVTLITLWAGLDPKNYRLRNEVRRLEDRSGLRFGSYGRVHTEPFLDTDTAGAPNGHGFTFTLAIDPTAGKSAGFRTIAAFHATDNRSQLVIGQWRDFIIVMNGDDYDNRRRLPRVTADTSLFQQRPLLVTVVSTAHGTSLYLNGERTATNARLQLALPSTPEPGRLVLGNSVNASQPWTGDLFHCALLPRPLSPGEVQRYDQSWRDERPPVADADTRPLLHFDFAAPDGATIRNLGTLDAPLIIPPRLHALGARALAWEVPAGTSNRGLALDAALNFLGFLPLGFACALVLKSPTRGTLTVFLVTTLAGFGVSLVIELTQAWLPSRDSSLRDLLLNTAGSPVGAWLLLATSRLTRPMR